MTYQDQDSSIVNADGFGPLVPTNGNDCDIPNNRSSISSFYNDKSIFITGASGFMGKVLVEKLLRSCPGLKAIYVLLRPKKNVDPQTRLCELLKSKIFDRVKEIDANLIKKVIVIPGDIVYQDMGISSTDIETLVEDVSIVFHSAATVKFDEPMKRSISFNTLGTRNMLDLCRKMKKLEAFVHVSTAYCNCDRVDIEEKFYPIGVKYTKIIELNEWMDDETLEILTPKLLGNRPNTYTYTKALAEALLLEESGQLPVSIVRPSIVSAAWREPYPGWVDNINGATGLVLAAGKGALRTMLYKKEACADLIPVDVVINAMIAIAWQTAKKRSNTIPIYNCTSGTLNTLRWGEFRGLLYPFLLKYPSQQLLRYPGGDFTQSNRYNEIRWVILHYAPAYFVDAFRMLCFKKPIMARIYNKLRIATKTFEYFTTHHWNFQATNLIQLAETLESIDQKEFHFDVRDLEWKAYWEIYILGIRKFVLKEDDSTLPKARRNLQRLYIIENMIMLFLILIFCCFTPIGQSALEMLVDGISTIFSLVFGSNTNEQECNHTIFQIASQINTTTVDVGLPSTSSSSLNIILHKLAHIIPGFSTSSFT